MPLLPVGFRMPRWVLQQDRSSSTNSARNRTRYLRPLAETVARAVSDYVAQRPDAEDVTLAVCESIGPTELERLGAERTPVQRETDMGLFVAQTLVNLYGAERVLTLRSDNGQDAHTRPNHRASVAWVTAFTPHRVLPSAPPPSPDRIVLDTSAIRSVIHQDPDALDVAELSRLRGNLLVSLADGAVAELAAALTQGRLDVVAWANRIEVFDAIIAQDLPFAPGGIELAALAGLRDPAGLDLDEMRAYYRGVWTHFRSIRTVNDITRAGPLGRLNRTHVEGVLEGAANDWTGWVDGARAGMAECAAQGNPVRDEEELRDLLRNSLRPDLSEQDLDRLDVAVRVIARRTFQTASAHGYEPEGHNDALDFDLLFGLALPAIVCTGDQRLINLARQTDAWDAWRVMSPQELIDWLRARPR